MNRNSALVGVVLIGTIITFAADIFLALAAAVLIQRSVIPFDSANVVIVVMAIVSALVGSLFCRKQSGSQKAGYLCALTVSILLAIVSFVADGAETDAASFIRTVLSVFVGAFLGNFLGKTEHNKLRKMKKKRAAYTK